MSDEHDPIEPVVQNDQLVCITGESGTGKSACLRNLPQKDRWLYLNCESGKRAPFRATWSNGTSQGTVITDPYDVWAGFDYAREDDDIDGVVIDTITFMMEMFESVYIVGAANTQAAWGNYAQFFKKLMQEKVSVLNKPCIMLGHTKEEFDEAAGQMKRSIPVKGSLKGNGLEAYFSTVVSTKRMTIKDLTPYHSELLNINDEEKELGYKHVFQTKVTKTTIGERIRSPMGMFSKEQTYMDNDVVMLLEHMAAFYGD